MSLGGLDVHLRVTGTLKVLCSCGLHHVCSVHTAAAVRQQPAEKTEGREAS